MNSKLYARDQTLTKTFELMRCGETEIKLHDRYKKVILVLGDTGNGKTKLVKWIAGDNSKLISKPVNKKCSEYLIEEINDACRSIITSETTYPQMMIDAETNAVFYDCPGFDDTRDASNEIATTYFIKKVVDHAESVKLIFAINYPAVRKGVERRSFMNLVKHIANFITDIEKFKDSIALVVTKVDNQYVKEEKGFTLVDNDETIETVADFLIEVKQELEVKLQNDSAEERQIHEVAIKFITILVRDNEQYSRIGIFRRPDQPGLLSEISLFQEEKKPIKTLIHEKLVFSKKENDDFGYTISEDCKNEILHLVEAINKSVKCCLCRIICEIKEHFTKIVDVLRSTVQSFLEETSPEVDLQEAREMSTRLRDGCRTVFGLKENVRSVTNPEDLAQKINAVVRDLNIDASTDDLVEIGNNGKCFNFLQVVSDEQLSIIQWDELFEVAVLYLSNASEELQKDVDVVEAIICKQIESLFQEMAKSLQDQFDEKAKTFDMNDVLVELSLYRDAMIKITEKIYGSMSITELLKIVSDAIQEIKIILPEQNSLEIIQKEKKFIFLQSINETKIEFVPSVWTHLFQNVIRHLDESKIWYKFLDKLYASFSEYEIQNNRDKYNVAYIEDWAKSGKPQGIVVTKNNFEQFLSNIANCNIVEYDKDVENITLTELRLNELNEVLNLTLKHRAVVQYAQPHVFIRADYISIKEIKVYSEQNSDDFPNLLAALKSGECKFLHIFALRKVFIDGDLSLPGVELCIISPGWEIIGIRKISLDGADGVAHSELKAGDGVGLGSNGKNGKPGLPGKPGGNFFGIAASMINSFNLTVTVSGGSGGPGQEGGNGQPGEDGVAVGHLTDNNLPEYDAGIRKYKVKGFPCVIERNWSGFHLLVGFLKIFNGDIGLNRLFKIPGSPGKAGGNGGDGGKGGKGGYPGFILLFNLNEESEITKSAVEGKNGANANGGVGGKGGMNGHTKYGLLEGLFKKEWLFQSEEPDKTFSIDLIGKGGTCGLNSSGLKAPEPANAINEPYKIIENYKIYAMANLLFRLKRPTLLAFIDLLNYNDKIKSLYSVDA